MPRLPRRLVLGAVLALGGLTAAACQAQPGAAAFVGGQRISDAQLASLVQAATRNPTFAQQEAKNPGSVARISLALLINHDVVAAAAAQEHVSVSTAQLDARMSQLVASAGGQGALLTEAANSGVPPNDVTTYVRDSLLETAMVARLTADIPVSTARLRQAYLSSDVRVHVAHILVRTKALADRILAEVEADPTRFAALARRYSIDTGSRASGGDLGTQAPSSYVAPFAAAVSTAPVGSFVEVHSQFGWHVVHVISRTATTSFAAAVPALRAQLLQAQAQARLTALLSRVSRRLDISVNPRYGRWNAATGQLTAAQGLSTPAPRQPPSGGPATP